MLCLLMRSYTADMCLSRQMSKQAWRHTAERIDPSCFSVCVKIMTLSSLHAGSSIPASTLTILLSKEVIAINQDSLGVPGDVVWKLGPLEVRHG